MGLAQRAAAAAIISGQYDDGLIDRYNIPVGASPNHVQHNGGIGRTGVRFETGSAGIGKVVKSVWIRFRKYGNPTGNITCNIRKAADDSAVLIRSFPIDSNQYQFSETGETVLILRNRFDNTYQMVAGDHVSIEFPSNATNGFEITTNSSAADPSGYTSRSHNGSVWSAALSDPLAIIIKTD